MMLIDMFRVNLSTNDIWILLQEFSSPYIIGIENPFKGVLQKDKEIIYQHTYQSLEQRDYIRFASDGKFAMNSTVHLCLKSIANPENVVVVSNTSDTGLQQVYYYFSDGYYVEKKIVDTGHFQLTLNYRLISLNEEIMSQFPITTSCEEKEISLPSDKIRELISEDNLSLSSKIKKLNTNNLLEEIANISNILSIYVFTHPQKKTSAFSSVTTLLSEDTIWLGKQKIITNKFMNFEQTTKSNINKKINRMLTFNLAMNKGDEMHRRIISILFASNDVHKYDLKSDIVLGDIISAIRVQEDYPEFDENGQVIRYGLFINDNLLDEKKTLEELNVKNSETMVFMIVSPKDNHDKEEQNNDTSSDVPFSFYPIDV
jgi:hypothetical protein